MRYLVAPGEHTVLTEPANRGKRDIVLDLKRLKTCMQDGTTLTLSFADTRGHAMKGADITLRAKTREEASARAMDASPRL